MDSEKTQPEKTEMPSHLVPKIGKLMFWSGLAKLRLRRGYYIPGIPEIKPEKLYEEIQKGKNYKLVDLRVVEELETDGYIKGAIMIPFIDFKDRMNELSKDSDIIVICPGGGASLVGAEMLIKSGFHKKKVKSLRGGVRAWKKKGLPLIEYFQLEQNKSKTAEEKYPFLKGKFSESAVDIDQTLDVRHLSCPGPVFESRKTIKKMDIGQLLEIITTDPGSLADIPSWAINTNQDFVSYNQTETEYRFYVRKL